MTVFVKICGITNEEDALLATAMGADAVGFVFAPSSRQIAPVRAGEIARRLPPEVLTVGVFRDEAPERVVEVLNTNGIKAAQLHGHESVADSTYVGKRVPFLIKAFAAGSPELEHAASHKAHAVMIDSSTPGSGQVFDWSLAEDAPGGLRIIMAGGLHPRNVQEAIEKVHPWGVDVSSGVEKAPGQKDPVKIRDFVAAAKAARVTTYQPRDDQPYDWQELG